LISLLDRGGARYRLIDHEPEGQTERASALRGHAVAAAVKCIVLIVKIGRKKTHFVLAVVPGDLRVDTGKIRGLFSGATYVGFAGADVAERLSGAVSGAVLPFSFHPELALIADLGVNRHDTIFFNAARLDRSLALATVDYLRLAEPRLVDIAVPNATSLDRAQI
jgi:Ala-tRNA(Pro) deacylase